MTGKVLNYTTTIPASRTVGECQALLARAGAASVAVHYDGGAPSGLTFLLRTPHGDRQFTLPVNVGAVQQLLDRQERAGQIRKGARGSLSTPEHATRVAWRIVKDWLEAQLAIIAAQMVTLPQVMLPYLHVDEDHTLYEVYQAREQAAIEAGPS